MGAQPGTSSLRSSSSHHASLCREGMATPAPSSALGPLHPGPPSPASALLGSTCPSSVRGMHGPGAPEDRKERSVNCMQISALRKYTFAFQKIELNGMKIWLSDYGYCSVDVLPGVSSRREFIFLCLYSGFKGLIKMQ